MAKRFVISETKGSQRSFSYLVGDDFPLGSWGPEEQPEDIVAAEVESLSQSDDCPYFAFAPRGELIVTVSEL